MGIRASAALNSEVCDHHPRSLRKPAGFGWELIGHNQTNALRLTEMDEAEERSAVQATIDRIETASGKRPVGWLGAGLAETWNTLDYLAEAGIRYGLRLGQRRPAISVRDRQPAAGVAALFGADQRRPGLLRDEGVGYRIRSDAAASVRHPSTARAKQSPASWRSRSTRSSPASRIGSVLSIRRSVTSARMPAFWRATGWEIVQHFLAQQPQSAR